MDGKKWGHWLVFGAVLLIAVSNAIKGGTGLYTLDRTVLNGIASVLLSIGAEVLLFYALVRWSADRTWSAACYALAIGLGASLLNWLFYMGRVDTLLSVALAVVGPGIASIGGMVVGEVERAEKREQKDIRAHEIRTMELEVENARQARLTALHERRTAEAQQPAMARPTNGRSFDKDQVKGQMLELWSENPGLSLQSLSRQLEPAYGTLHGYKDELVAEGRLEMRGKKYYPNGGHYG